MTGPRCIVCGRPIKKRRGHVHLRSEEQAERGIGGRDWLTIPKLPRRMEDVRRLTNAPHITKLYRRDGAIVAFNTWDGESYEDAFFCTQYCARLQGYASAKHGARFEWKGGVR